eukprot:scaffold7951_cov444-Prasinococcus_capsulatus_cf.AAC.3
MKLPTSPTWHQASNARTMQRSNSSIPLPPRPTQAATHQVSQQLPLLSPAASVPIHALFRPSTRALARLGLSDGTSWSASEGNVHGCALAIGASVARSLPLSSRPYLAALGVRETKVCSTWDRTSFVVNDPKTALSVHILLIVGMLSSPGFLLLCLSELVVGCLRPQLHSLAILQLHSGVGHPVRHAPVYPPQVPLLCAIAMLALAYDMLWVTTSAPKRLSLRETPQTPCIRTPSPAPTVSFAVIRLHFDGKLDPAQPDRLRQHLDDDPKHDALAGCARGAAAGPKRVGDFLSDKQTHTPNPVLS